MNSATGEKIQARDERIQRVIDELASAPLLEPKQLRVLDGLSNLDIVSVFAVGSNLPEQVTVMVPILCESFFPTLDEQRINQLIEEQSTRVAADFDNAVDRNSGIEWFRLFAYGTGWDKAFFRGTTQWNYLFASVICKLNQKSANAWLLREYAELQYELTQSESEE